MHAPLLFYLESCWANSANYSQYLESKHCGAKNAKKKLLAARGKKNTTKTLLVDKI